MLLSGVYLTVPSKFKAKAMPSFRYLARDQFGVLQSGFLESDGREAAVAQLDHEGYFPIEIEEEERMVNEPAGHL